MDKRQLIQAIQQYNPSATEKFLTQFETVDLEQYLSHLKAAAERTVHIAGWVRRQQSRYAVAV